MQLDLTDEETRALLNLLMETIENDRYPFSPRIQLLRTSRSDNHERPKFYSRIDQGDRVAIGRRSGRRYGRKITGPAATII
jgi:hypothetical protein